MARPKAVEEPLADRFVNAIAYLHDVTKLHTDPNIASIRADLVRDGSDKNVSNDAVRALEVNGIARAIAARFSGKQRLHEHATQAATTAAIFSANAQSWSAKHDAAIRTGVSASAVEECRDGYRDFMLKYLDWVHKDGAFHDGTYLCPVTAYLQLILRHTPIEDWATAAADSASDNSDASPLAFAWAWARKSPGTASQAADVAVLVTMGRHVHRLMADVPVKAEEDRISAAISRRTVALTEGVWAALRTEAKYSLTGAATRLRTSRSESDNRKRERIEAEELLATVQNAAKRLGEAGTQYAQLLGEQHMIQERESIVGSIRSWAGFILLQAEPPTPEKVLLAISDLAKIDH